MRKQLLFLFFITFSLCGFAQQNDSRIPAGTLITYAAKLDQFVEDGDGNNSPFTSALLEHLGDPDDIAVVLRKVGEKVSKNTNGWQQPVGLTSLAGGTLVFSAIKSNSRKVNDLGQKDIQDQGVSFDSVVENMPGKTKLIFLDANRDNPFIYKSR
jgi:uncharacterized caspase-like protein